MPIIGVIKNKRRKGHDTHDEWIQKLNNKFCKGTSIEYEQERQKEIEELKGKVNTDEYIEKMASEKLGLIKSNAKVFVDVSGEQQ